MKITNKIILGLLIAVSVLQGAGYAEDVKEEGTQYITKINPVLVNMQLVSRNMTQNLITAEKAAEQMKEHIAQLRAITPPLFMKRQHEMLLLSLQKMKMGFYLLSKGDGSVSIPLVRKGAELLRMATKNIVDFAKKEGIIKEKGKNQATKEKGADK